MKTITVGQFLTDQEIAKAIKIFREDHSNFHERVRTEIIEPNIGRINAALGQDNDARYLTYAVEYAMTAYSRRR